MPKQSVIDMLKKPVQKTAGRIEYPQAKSGGLPSIMEAELHDMAMERIHKKAFDNAMAELGPKIADAEGRANKAELELAETKSSLVTLQAKHKEMEAMHMAEKLAKEAANRACDEECEKTRKLELQVSQMTGRITELERHNNSMQTNFSAVTAEIGKRKPEPVKTATQIPELDFEVTSRGLKGEIKTVTIKPKK